MNKLIKKGKYCANMQIRAKEEVFLQRRNKKSTQVIRTFELQNIPARPFLRSKKLAGHV